MPDVIYEGLYYALMEDVKNLRDDLRSLQLKASDREATAYEDAWDMTSSLIYDAERQQPQ